MITKEDMFNFLLLPITAVVFLAVLIDGRLNGETYNQTLNNLVYEY